MSKKGRARRTPEERAQAKRVRVIVAAMQRGTFQEERTAFFDRLTQPWRQR